MSQPTIVGTVEDDSRLKAAVSSILQGFSGGDIIIGSKFADVIFGGDTTWGPGPEGGPYIEDVYRDIGDDDTIRAGDGNDIINVGTGTDSIDGGKGLDQLDFYHGSVSTFFTIQKITEEGQSKYVPHATSLHNLVIDLKTGSYSGDYIGGDNKTYGHDSGSFKNIEAILGSAHNDIIRGSDHNDQFKPISGADTIDGRKGFDVLSYNDAGSEGIIVNWSTLKVRDSFGDTDSFQNIEQIIGTAHADTFNGAAGQQIFTGGNGGDKFSGGGGVDIVDYHLETGTRGLLILLKNGTGSDTYGASDTFDSIEDIRGSVYKDVISGNGLANEFWGDGGDDNIDGGDRNDTVHGGEGKDTLLGGIGDDSLLGDAGNDILKGSDGKDTLSGGDGADTLDGQKGDDVLFGDAGDDKLTDNSLVFDDMLFGMNGNSLNGGAGEDIIKGAGVLHGDADNDQLFGIGSLYGDDGDDHLEATAVDGMPGGNNFYVHLIGGPGKDTLVNSLFHGLGLTVADYSYLTAGIDLKFTPNKIDLGGRDIDILVNIIRLQGTNFNDTLTAGAAGQELLGGKGNDSMNAATGGGRLDGDAGNDTLHGGAGRDGLYGGDDADLLLGGANNDFLLGENGNDKIHTGSSTADGIDEALGGAGNDTFYADGTGTKALDGGTGSDTFIFSSGANGHVTGGGGTDHFIIGADASGSIVISDFTRGHETVDLAAFHIKDFAALQALGHDEPTSGYVYYELSSSITLTFLHTALGDLAQGDFIL